MHEDVPPVHRAPPRTTPLVPNAKGDVRQLKVGQTATLPLGLPNMNPSRTLEHPAG